MQQKKTVLLVWLVIALASVSLFFVWHYWDYGLARRTLPEDTAISDLPVGGMTKAEALNALEVAFAKPLTVTYQSEALSLSPSLIDLQYDSEKTADRLDLALAHRQGVDGFIAHVLRQPSRPVRVDAVVTYSEERLSQFLAAVARRYDGPPRAAVALPEHLDFRAGRPGTSLRIDVSYDRLTVALVSAPQRQVSLVVDVRDPPPRDLRLLQELLLVRLQEHPGLIPGIFVRDLQSSEQVAINAQVPFAGLSVLKIAVLEEAYRQLDQPPGPEVTRLISETVMHSDNAAANLLLRDVIDEGDAYRAARELTNSMRLLGLLNTYMAAPYEKKEGASEIATPANVRTDVRTEPDPFIQTTPQDIGLFLEMIYECARDHGVLRSTYPDTVSAEECAEIIQWMRLNPTNSLIEAGLPPFTEVAHKHGWTSDTHADAGLLFTPGGDFVLVVFLHRARWLEWDESAPLFADVATAAYNFFNPSP